MRPSRLRVVAVAAALGAACAIPSSASAYKLIGHRWAGNTVTYYTEAKAHSAAVDAAARAWNRSGVRIRFVRTSRARARLIVRYQPRAVCVGFAFVPLGISTLAKSTVLLPRFSRGTAYCTDRFTMTLTAAHEFGHVLGLFHERRRCALMNPQGNWLGGLQCGAFRRTGSTPWLWRCRVLEPDDLRGAVAIYGGRARRVRGPFCETYRRQRAPGGLVLAASAEDGSVQATFRRPRDPRIPRMIKQSVKGVGAGFVLDYAKDTCPDRLSGFPRNWGARPGGLERETLSGLEPGRWCVVVRGVDRAQRPGATARAFVDVPAPPPPEPEPEPEA